MTGQFLGMSDDDFLKLNPAEATIEGGQGEGSDSLPASGAEDTIQGAEGTEGQDTLAQDDTLPAGEGNDTLPAGEGEDTLSGSQDEEVNPLDTPDDQIGDKPPEAKKKEEEKPAEGAVTAPGSDSPKPEEGKKPEGEGDKKTEEEAKPVDYEAFYNDLIGKPIKANNKEIVLNSPEEVKRLIQMGAGYGRKVQELAPHLKTIRMLEKANLLDPNELSFLIDIRDKNPEAIKKLIKESGIDPLDINTEDTVTYTPTDKSVSDKEMAFHTALKEVQEAPSGVETIDTINQTWDQESKSLLWDSPELLGIFQTQVASGLYAEITAEIDRQKLLGQIPSDAPFLKAYKSAGDYLRDNGGFKSITVDESTTTTTETETKPPEAKPQPKVLATRTADPKPTISNSDKARAASPTQSTSRKADTVRNPLELPDDEFMKQFDGRF